MSTKSFTVSYRGIANKLRSDAKVSRPVHFKEGNEPQLFDGVALWDTGATHCSIHPDVVHDLGLQPINQVTVRTGHGEKERNQYLVHLWLPNRVIVPGVRATEVESIIGGFDVLVGMEVIMQGDFAVTHDDDQTKFTFRMPSVDHIDFVEQTPDPSFEKDIGSMESVGRNDPVIAHKPGELRAVKAKSKYIEKAIPDGDPNDWELIVPPESR